MRVACDSAVKSYSVCIVTPGYISSSPRVVREADALSRAGYGVRVVFTQGDIEWARCHDALLLREKSWRWAAVGWSQGRPGERGVYWRATLAHQLARRLPAALWPLCAAAERAEGRLYSRLARVAAAEPADLFIGHYPVGLAAAAYAASCWRAKLGYDAEDLHTAEPPRTKAGWRRTSRIDFIERKYLPLCAHLTAVSSGVADALARRYHVPRPLVIHNVFPFRDRAKLDCQKKDRRGPGLSLYWFSQTIGLDRGLQDAIRACSLMDRPVQIHLRGSHSVGVRAALLSLARDCGVAEHLYFHPPVPPTELLSRACEHDVGLALEQPLNASRMFSVTNKFFLFLLAALAVAATDVPGQRALMAACGTAGCLYPPADYRALACHLETWVRLPHTLQACKQAALTAASSRWNWEHESQKLLEAVEVLRWAANRSRAKRDSQAVSGVS